MDTKPKQRPSAKRSVAIPLWTTALLLASASPAQADHHAPDCFGGHDGLYAFPLTLADITLTMDDDPELGPLAGLSDSVTFTGPTVVRVEKVSSTELRSEIVGMQLVGFSPVFGPITVTESPLLASVGTTTAAGSGCFPAASDFEVFLQTVTPFPLHNQEPFTMEATLHDVPPAPGDVYVGTGSVTLYDPLGEGRGTVDPPEHDVDGPLPPPVPDAVFVPQADPASLVLCAVNSLLASPLGILDCVPLDCLFAPVGILDCQL